MKIDKGLIMSGSDTDLQTQIVMRGFNFYYGKYHALRNINLEIYERRETAFIGPSG